MNKLMNEFIAHLEIGRYRDRVEDANILDVGNVTDKQLLSISQIFLQCPFLLFAGAYTGELE
jgi:hypothetical protein